ncbi:MAG: site-specific DNA-methyltransferase [Oscillospiraceae bacterium]|nr:site-specific DNA-methyltransferase [Oscillospiraceae bacterium]
MDFNPKTAAFNEYIKGLIVEIDRRVLDKIIEQTNADLIKKLITNADTLDEAISIAMLGTTYKRTGFHFDKRLEKTDNTIRYFKKNEALSFKTSDDTTTHKLIIGDNYDALHNLLIQYRGKVDVIYIDPPYGKDKMGKFAVTNYNNAITRDNLLSMLYPRLVLARQLLSDEGVIFCSIDDRNHAYVKCLFDEIFEERNFIGEYVWQSKLTGGYDNDNINMQHEYVLAYGNNKAKNTLSKEECSSTKYTLVDEDGRYYKWDSLWNVGGLSYSKSLDYAIIAPDGTEIWPCGERGVAFWLWSQDKVEKEKRDLKFSKDKNGEWKVYKKVYALDTIVSASVLLDAKIVKGNTNATAEIKSIFETKLFDYAKPVELIKYLVERGEKTNNGIVMDFFAGSGTTGQAVVELNCSDKGTRTFIGVQLDENLDEVLDTAISEKEKSMFRSQIAFCDKYQRPHLLSEITAERLRRVMTGKCYDGTDNFKWVEKNKPLGGNLDVYDIGQVISFGEVNEGFTPFDVIDETLYGQDEMDTASKIKWVCENFEGTRRKLDKE